MDQAKKANIFEIASVFFKLGAIAFGGPAAHIAMMEKEIIEKRKWMDHQHFLDLIGMTSLIPGPNSTEMTMHCGHHRGGILGLFVAGISFITPAVIITGFLAYLYITYGELPAVKPFIYGIKPAVLSIIAMAIFKLGKKALKNTEIGILGVLILIAAFAGLNEVYALLLGGIIGATYFYFKHKSINKTSSIVPILLLQTSTGAIATKLTSMGVFWVFLKVGSILYGSGYVLFAYLDAELVANGWLTRQELLDAIAVGQFTPGPVLSTATFIGYQIAGLWGALGATAGIFLPSFIFVMILNPLIPRMRKSKFLSYFLDAVNIAAVAIMIAVLFGMAKDTLINWQSITIALASVIVAFQFKKVGAMWIILGGSLLGYFLLLI